MIDWIVANWVIIVVPTAIFILAIIATLWLRRRGFQWLDRQLGKTKLPIRETLLQALRFPSILWCLIISAYLGVTISALPDVWKGPVANGLWTVFIASLTIPVLTIVSRVILFQGRRLHVPLPSILVFNNIVRIVIIIIALLTVLDLWGVPTSPFILLIAIVVLVSLLVFRDAFPNLFAGFQLSASQQIKVGDYIKLETGEEGYVVDMSWNVTRIHALDESVIIIPNRHLIQKKVINYGRPLKKAKEPFHFYSRTHLTELTGLKAKNIRELLSILKTAPDPVIYYHTHSFLEQHHYLTPEPSNDFGVWVSDALGDEVLGERLASIDTFEFSTLAAYRERLVSTIGENLSVSADYREAMPGREFYFMKAVSFIFPTTYLAHDLREFVETLRKISLGSLYFHVFESRLRLGKGRNDFSTWLIDSLGETELGEVVASLDPYTYTLEGLRSVLIQLIEKRIK